MKIEIGQVWFYNNGRLIKAEVEFITPVNITLKVIESNYFEFYVGKYLNIDCSEMKSDSDKLDLMTYYGWYKVSEENL